jgi:AcrR family transcriptional regulator
LSKSGLEAATIPRIAARARLSPGTVYRRFPDKDALLRELCIRMLEDSYEKTREFLQPARWQGISLAQMSRAVISTLLTSNAANRRLLHAHLLFTLQHTDVDFVRKMDELRWRVFRDVCALLLTRRDEIAHPDPEAAVNFAMLTVGMMAQGILVLPSNPSDFYRALPDVEGHLQRELPVMFLRYLGVAA